MLPARAGVPAASTPAPSAHGLAPLTAWLGYLWQFQWRSHSSKKWSISCHYQYAMLWQSSVTSSLPCELLSPKGTLEGEYLRSGSCQMAATPYGESQGNSGCEKHRVLAQDSSDTHERKDFSEPKLLHLPIYRKALNSLTWVIWFSLINNNLLMFRLPAICRQTSLYSGSSPSSEQLSQGPLRCCLQGLKS